MQCFVGSTASSSSLFSLTSHVWGNMRKKIYSRLRVPFVQKLRWWHLSLSTKGHISLVLSSALWLKWISQCKLWNLLHRFKKTRLINGESDRFDSELKWLFRKVFEKRDVGGSSEALESTITSAVDMAAAAAYRLSLFFASVSITWHVQADRFVYSWSTISRESSWNSHDHHNDTGKATNQH